MDAKTEQWVLEVLRWLVTEAYCRNWLDEEDLWLYHGAPSKKDVHRWGGYRERC